MRGRRRAAVAVALTVVSAALLVRSPALAEGVTTTPSPGSPILGFDAASAPDQAHMDAWLGSSYRAVGVYIPVTAAFDSRYDTKQSNLTPSWIASQLANGWSIVPIYVGLQAPAPCGGYKLKMSADPAAAYRQGVAAATDASASLGSLGLPADAPVYYDLESYSAGCSSAVQAFLGAWSSELNTLGHLSGVYGSRGSTMADIVARYAGHAPGCSLPSALWAPQWDKKATVTPLSPIPDDAWTNERIKQSAGPHDETYGGKKINVDTDVIAGPVVGPSDSPAASVTPVAGPCIPAPPDNILARRGNRSAVVTWAATPVDEDGGSAVTGYEVTNLATGVGQKVSATTTSLRMTGLANGKQYSFAVTALNNAGHWSSVRSATVTVTPAGPPAQVAKPTTKAVRHSITVGWRPAAANGSPITGYRVSVGSHRVTVAPGKRSVTVRNLRPGTYRVTVTAVNAVGAGPVSPAVRVRLRSRP